MNIFSQPNRNQEDAIKKPLIYGDITLTQKRLKNDHDREANQFQIYLKNLYAKFDFKINQCKYKCAINGKSYHGVRDCEEKCDGGVVKFSTYIDNRVEEMQELLAKCVDNSSKLPNAMDQIYYCYQKYNKSFTKLKEFITEESMYYQ